MLVKKPGLRIASVGIPALLLLTGPLSAGSPVDAAESSASFAPWKAVAASGTVESRPAADEQLAWNRVARGDELHPATLIRTGRAGRATLTAAPATSYSDLALFTSATKLTGFSRCRFSSER